MKKRIYLSPPNIDQTEKEAVHNALESGWVAPMGPQLDSFEDKLANHHHGRKVLLLNSGTSALHTSLILSGVVEGDEVLTSSMTFAACANVILYQKAKPVFMDSEEDTWNMDPGALSDYLDQSTKKPKAIMVTHLYGVPAKIKAIKEIATRNNIMLIEDAAEALGSTHENQPVGSFGDYGILSFNGNKIITSSCGGALICNEEDYAKGLHLVTQANRGLGGYDHDQVGYNYRMSNILAGLGEAQLAKLNRFLVAKKKIFERYKEELSDYLQFPVEVKPNKSNYWLSTGLIRSDHDPDELIAFLIRQNIETRRLWKPLHIHLPYQDYKFIGNGICKTLFQKGICLPSGSGISHDQQSEVIDSVKRFFRK